MGVVGVAKEEDEQEQHGGDGESGINEARGVVAAVVHAHEQDHGKDAGEGPSGLAANEGVGGVIALLGHDGGGGKDHDEADHHQKQGGEEEPLVDAFQFCHGATFVRFNSNGNVKKQILRSAQDDNSLVIVSWVGCGDSWAGVMVNQSDNSGAGECGGEIEEIFSGAKALIDSWDSFGTTKVVP